MDRKYKIFKEILYDADLSLQQLFTDTVLSVVLKWYLIDYQLFMGGRVVFTRERERLDAQKEIDEWS